MLQTQPQIIRTIGIEFETENIPSHNQLPLRGSGGWKFTHDASIESPMYSTEISGRYFLINSDRILLNKFPFRTTQVGTELVSGILDSESDEFLPELENLCVYVQDGGEKPQSNRAGIHYHISMPQPSVSILRNILRLGAYFEALFFHIGGMGYPFRGIENDSIYCRPITKYGPPYIPYKGRWAQCYNLNSLVGTQKTTLENFWTLYGDCYNHDNRYTPVRYSWLNLFPMFPSKNGNYRGTCEFRVFNKTLNPFYIYNTVKLCQSFVKLSLLSSIANLKFNGILGKENSVFENCNTVRLLHEFKNLAELDDKVFKGLLQILESTPQPVLPEKKVKTHLLDRNDLNPYWTNADYIPATTNEVVAPKYITIHNIEQMEAPPRRERMFVIANNNNNRINELLENFHNENNNDPFIIRRDDPFDEREFNDWIETVRDIISEGIENDREEVEIIVPNRFYVATMMYLARNNILYLTQENTTRLLITVPH